MQKQCGAIDQKSYDDIIHLPHKQSAARPHMSLENRAAQFAPFAALVGYDDAVRETSRVTDSKRDLSDSQLEILNAKLNCLQEHITDNPVIEITYFVPDLKKDGGAYFTISGSPQKIDDYDGIVVMDDGTKIPVYDIYDISGDIFSALETDY